MKTFLAMLMAAFLFTTVVGCSDKPKDKEVKKETKTETKEEKKTGG